MDDLTALNDRRLEMGHTWGTLAHEAEVNVDTARDFIQGKRVPKALTRKRILDALAAPTKHERKVLSIREGIAERQQVERDVVSTWPAALDALTDLLGAHRELRIYDVCGHQHEPGVPGTVDVEAVGLTCEDGYERSICWRCCTHDTGYQEEACAAEHYGCWPCLDRLSLERIYAPLSH